MKTLKNVKMWRGSQNEDNETQTSSWFVTWRRLHNVQTKKESHHAEMPVKYFLKISFWNAMMHNDKE